MNKNEKELIKTQLSDEQKTLKELKQVYQKASDDLADSIYGLDKKLGDDPNLQSVIYQKQYQEAIKTQVDEVLKNLSTNAYNTIEEYLNDSYVNGYTGNMWLLQMQTGTTGIAKACTYYNQLLNKLGIGNKYEEIRVGDKVRFCYIEPNNKYNINCIAYRPGQYPKEFKKIFRPDYYTMFNKIILDPLKRFRIACKFKDSDPSD